MFTDFKVEAALLCDSIAIGEVYDFTLKDWSKVSVASLAVVSIRKNDAYSYTFFCECLATGQLTALWLKQERYKYVHPVITEIRHV